MEKTKDYLLIVATIIVPFVVFYLSNIGNQPMAFYAASACMGSIINLLICFRISDFKLMKPMIIIWGIITALALITMGGMDNQGDKEDTFIVLLLLLAMALVYFFAYSHCKKKEAQEKEMFGEDEDEDWI